MIGDKGALCVPVYKDDVNSCIETIFQHGITDCYAVFLEMRQKQAAGGIVSELCDEIDLFAKAGQGVGLVGCVAAHSHGNSFCRKGAPREIGAGYRMSQNIENRGADDCDVIHE